MPDQHATPGTPSASQPSAPVVLGFANALTGAALTAADLRPSSPALGGAAPGTPAAVRPTLEETLELLYNFALGVVVHLPTCPAGPGDPADGGRPDFARGSAAGCNMCSLLLTHAQNVPAQARRHQANAATTGAAIRVDATSDIDAAAALRDALRVADRTLRDPDATAVPRTVNAICEHRAVGRAQVMSGRIHLPQPDMADDVAQKQARIEAGEVVTPARMRTRCGTTLYRGRPIQVPLNGHGQIVAGTGACRSCFR